MDWSFVGQPLLPASTSIVLLLLLHSRVPRTLFLLLAALLFGVNPVYSVAVVVLVKCWKAPVNKAPKSRKKAVISTPERVLLGGKIPLGLDFYVVGNDLSAYYCAALLSRMNYSVCVLEPADAPPVRVQLPGVDEPVTCCDLSSGRMDRLKVLLDAVCLPGQARLEYASVGSDGCSQAHTIVRLLGGLKADEEDTVVAIRPSLKALVEDMRLVDNSMTDQMANHILTTLEQLLNTQELLTGFLLSRMVDKSEADRMLQQIGSTWNNLHSTTCDQLLKGIPESAQALLMAYFQEEPGVSPTELSGLALATALAQGVSPRFVVKGGYNAILETLSQVIESSGGAAFSDVPISAFRTEGFTTDDTHISAICVGGDLEIPISDSSAVISCMGWEYTAAVLRKGRTAQAPLQEPAIFSELPIQRCSTVKLVVAFQCQHPEAAGIGPQTFIEMARAGDGRDQPSLDIGLQDHFKVYFPSLRDPQTQPNIHTCVLEAYWNGADSIDQRSLEHILQAHLFRLFPAISHDSIISQRLIVHPIYTRGLTHSTKRYQTVASTKTEINRLLIAGCDISTFGVGGCLQAGWVAANAALHYTAAELLAGTNVLNDVLHS